MYSKIFNSFVKYSVLLLAVWLLNGVNFFLRQAQCIIFFKKPTMYPSLNKTGRILPTARICVDHHPPGYNTTQLGRGPYNVSAKWWSHRYMSICIERTEFRTFFRGALVQVSYRGEPFGRLSSDFNESAYIHCPPGGQNTYYTYYTLKRKQAWYRWYPPNDFNFREINVDVHCTVIKEPGLYWRLNVTSRYKQELAQYSSEYDNRYPLYEVSWALDKDGRPYHLRKRWAMRRKWAFRHGLFTSPEIYSYRNRMLNTLSRNNSNNRPLLHTMLRLRKPTFLSVWVHKNFTGHRFSSLKKILSPDEQPYWNRYKIGKEKFYYDGISTSHQCP